MIKNLKVCCIQKVIPLAFDESLSYLETLYAILNKLNETIDQLNINTNDIANIKIAIETINTTINALKTKHDKDINNLQTQLTNAVESFNIAINSLYTNITTETGLKLINLDTKLTLELQNAINEVYEKIHELEIGNVNAFNPTTGLYENVSKVITNVYDALRYYAITAQDFDSIGLTCDEFDAKEIIALDFDTRANAILLEVDINELLNTINGEVIYGGTTI